MRWERIRTRGLGPFKREVDIVLPTGGELVALVGENGAGKSTLLELLTAALYRTCPTRGTLADLATTRDAFVEVNCVNGQAFRVRQQVDAITGKGESLALDVNGDPLLESTKVRDWDRWAAAHIERPEVLFSGQVAVQGRRGFLDLSRADRVRVLNRALGVERYELMASAAAERAKAAKAELDAVRARHAEVPRFEMDHLHAELDHAQHKATRAAEATKAARLAHQRAQAAAADAARAMELVEQRRAAVRRLEAAQSQKADLETRIGKNRVLLARAEEIRIACEGDARSRAELEARRAELAEVKARGTTAHSEERAARAARDQAERALQAVLQRIERAEVRLKDRPAVERACVDEQQLRRLVNQSEESVTSLLEEEQRLQELQLEGKDRRIAGLRSGLQYIIDRQDLGAPSIAGGALADDDALAQALADAPSRLAGQRRDITAAQRALSDLRTKLRTAEQLAARAGEMDVAQAERDAARTEVVSLEAVKADASGRLGAAVETLNNLSQQSVDVSDSIHLAEQAIAALAPTVALLPHLDRAEALIEERTRQLAPVLESITAAEAELAALPDVSQPEAVDLGALEARVAESERLERESTAASARAAQAVEAADKAHARRAELEVEVRAAEAEMSDWTRLAQDLGRDGLQALEIDAAIPELNEICNALLHTCHGPRFTVELRTDRLTADGKKTVEDLEVRVIDTVEGRDAEASTYSGGELVIVGEAIALALTTIACRRSGVERPSLIRDESGAALSAENARAYIAMLRMAARQIGAAHVLLVSHVPEIQELADVRVEISADHQVTIGGVS